MRIYALILFVLGATLVGAQPADPLRADGETSVISFRLAGSLKYVSVCENLSAGNSYIVYRSGLPSRIELEYPKDKSASWRSFEYAFYLRGGGAENAGLDLNYLTFFNGDWEYVIYEEYFADTGATNVGIRLVNEKEGKELDLPALGSSVQGSLGPLRDDERVPKGEIPNY